VAPLAVRFFRRNARPFAVVDRRPSVPCSGAIDGQGEVLKKRATFEVVFSPTGRLLAPLMLLASAFLPPDGLGFDICLVHRITGLSCIGCGLSRSITCLTHGRVQDAAAYHPFGIVFYVILLALTLHSVLPRSWGTRVRRAALEHERWLRPAYRLFVVTFIGFGVVRFVLEALISSLPPR
jgi:hypothetical protein